MKNDNMTGAELQTMREGVNLSREELGALVGVAARTVKHWENGRTGVPADVAQAVADLEEGVSLAALADLMRWEGIIQDRSAARVVALVRYRQDSDVVRMGPAVAGYPVAIHGAIVARVRAELLDNVLNFCDQSVRVVWFDAAEYGAWLAQVGVPDTPEALDHWALQQVAQQARAHRADQPPA